MTKRLLLVHSFVLLALLPPWARSQDLPDRGFEAAGVVGWTSVQGADGKSHAAFGGEAGYNVNKHAQIFGEFLYNTLGSLTDTELGVTATANEKAYSVGPGVRIHFGEWAHIAPYVVFSGGFYRLSAESSGISLSQSGGYFAAGGGASIFVSKNFGFRPEARLEAIHLGNLLGISGTSANGHCEVLTVGVFYQSGRQ